MVLKYFPELSEKQVFQLHVLSNKFQEINANVNLISRKDASNLFERHILHSLSIAKYIQFPVGCHIADAGTGGGFPGLPLAVYFKDVRFTLIDSIAKKTNAVKEMAHAMELNNVIVVNSRIEQVNQTFDYAVSRAVAPLTTLKLWMKGKISGSFSGSGLICLKGGNLDEEIKEVEAPVKLTAVSDYFEEDFFKEKFILHIRC